MENPEKNTGKWASSEEIDDFLKKNMIIFHIRTQYSKYIFILNKNN